VVVSEEVLVQVDLHDMAKADDDSTHEVPVGSAPRAPTKTGCRNARVAAGTPGARPLC
jgi:hypothetical protein